MSHHAQIPTPAGKALESLAKIGESGRKIIVFLDYDGTLTPIVSNPDDAKITDEMREVVRQVSERYSTAIITGRGIDKIRSFVQLDSVYYAGSHGFDIRAPGNKVVHQVASEYLPALAGFAAEASKAVAGIEGALVEDNRFSVSVHYRNVQEEVRPRVEEAVDKLIARPEFATKLQKRQGKMVWEIRPALHWHKGQAVLWLLKEVWGVAPPEEGKGSSSVIPVYIGDDWTDEDAFKALRAFPDAATVFVRPPGQERQTAAEYFLETPSDVRAFLTQLLAIHKERGSPAAGTAPATAAL